MARQVPHSLLNLVSVGLLAIAAWSAYDPLPEWSARAQRAAADRGQVEAAACLARGRAARTRTWRYVREPVPPQPCAWTLEWWWLTLREANITGKVLPPSRAGCCR